MDIVKEIKDGRLHCHSENSIKDGLTTVDEMCQITSQMGARALAITDHGTVAGWWSFAKAAKKYGIKPIYGVEAYIGKHHLIMLAKNNVGLQTISLMVTESNKNLDVAGKNVYPRMSKEMVERFLGEGTEGHGNVILTSACIGGVLAGLALDKEKAQKELAKLNDKLERAEDAKRIFDGLSKKFELASEALAQAKVQSKPTGFKKRERAINMRPDGPEKEEALKALHEEQDRASQILAMLPELSQDKKKLQKQLTACRKELMPEDKLQALREEKKKWDGVNIDNASLEELMRKEAMDYDRIAGHGNFYIELQYHNDPREKLWMPVLDKIAHELNIPVIAANDEHMPRKEDVEARKYLNSLRYITFNWEAPSASDKELYFKSDAALSDMLMQCIGNQEHVTEAMENIGHVIDECNAEFTARQAYPKFEPSWTKEQSDAELERMARSGIATRYPNWSAELEQRLQYELHIIETMGYTDYFLIVQWYVNWGRELGHMPEDRFEYLKAHINEMSLDETLKYIQADQSAPGLAVGPGRGSGAGSIVCYLTGITSIDPIANGLVFERFLNPERVSMPDIDEDFAKFIRSLLIEIVRKKFGHDGVACIMTRGTLAAKAAIQMVAKVHGSRKKGDASYFLGLGREMSSMIPATPKAAIADSEDVIKEKYKDNDDALEILKQAKRLEGTYVQTGMHAAGVVIVDNGDIKQYTPLMWDPKNNLWKTQMDKDEVEKNKMLKMDFLGLVNLDIITGCLRRIKKNHPNIPQKELDVESYEFRPDIIKKIYATADTDSVFQFESGGMKKMLLQFQPESFSDLVLLNAAYRPGPMQFLPDVIDVKHHKKDPSYLCQQLEPILKDTYGNIIYQEQVMEIFKQLAGYSLGGADLVRRAMGHKEMEILVKERDAFVHGDPSRNIKGCKANGIDETAANILFDQMMEFAKYAFNKSHAAAYSKVSYITAYLKAQYPVEYFCTDMSFESMDKMPALIAGCKKRGIKVHTPDINRSEEAMSNDGSTIYFGLGNVLGVAAAAKTILDERRLNGEFSSIEDFLTRVNCEKGVFLALAKAGAFDELYPQRMDLIDHAEIICAAAKDARTCMKTLAKKTELLTALDEGNAEKARSLNGGKIPNRKILVRGISDQRSKLAQAQVELSRKNISDSKFVNTIDKLDKEKEVLGMYVSGSPLDGYRDIALTDGYKENKHKRVDRLTADTRIKILAFPENFKDALTKKDNKPFLIFTIETKFGTMKAMCFNADTISFIKSSGSATPIVVRGLIREDRDDAEQMMMIVSDAEEAKGDYTRITVSVNNIGIWDDLCTAEKMSKVAADDREYMVTAWIDGFTGEVRTANLAADEEILKKMQALGDLSIHF